MAMDIKKLESQHEIQVSIDEIISSIKKFLIQDIIVTNVRVLDKNEKEILYSSDTEKEYSIGDLSNNPGIYSFHRPSFFTEIEEEYNKMAAAKKATREAEKTMRHRICFWRGLNKKMSEQAVSIEALSAEVDQERKKQIVDLLNNSEISNEEKYLKYMLLTPGMDKEYLKTLMGADEIGINANIIIELLEQPKESFCKETIEAYVSEVRKGNGYNLKKELAEELIKGEWSIVSDINGEPCKYQLIPVSIIENIKKNLLRLTDQLKNPEGLGLSQQEEEIAETEEADSFSEFELTQKELAEEFLSEEVEFDDSMVDFY